MSATALRRFERWRSSRQRAFDSLDFDHPRFEWRQSKVICVVRPGEQPGDLERTCRSLFSQDFPFWSALVIDRVADDSPSSDPRVAIVQAAALDQQIRGRGADCLVCVATAGNIITPEAFAIAAETAHRYPADHIFYGDVVWTKPDGSQEPVLTPGWSPRLQTGRSFLHEPVFVRASYLAQLPEVDLAAFLEQGQLPTALPPNGVRPLRRLLASRSTPPPHPPTAAVAAVAATSQPPSPGRTIAGTPSATIVIPTRDQPALLTRVIASIRAKTSAEACEILVINNGGSRVQAEAALASLGSPDNVSLIDYDGPFNFSAICNAGAAAGRGAVLVFLNDDTEVLTDGWLDRLIAHASDPAIGAVGARLTYPDGRLQHIGIVLGLWESTGHFGALDAGTAAGWARRNVVVHEVGAVTGACLAVARTKFDAVGGFDADDLPIELGDVDLCLKLRARGWPAIVDPAIHIVHAESASRGRATFRPLTVHARERAIFSERWRHMLRDDPYFHPALSLYSLRAALA